MKSLLKLRRLTRKRAYLSHKPEWLIVDALVTVLASGLIMFFINAICNGIKPW